ncbi:lipopolysaccharide biosynthesis protein [Flavobacterium sp. HBTb2-11-1]|uniref:lipopolysaccharide biosynthesis protein n=1 Tax=Flavobacterium sp. HBTb2-11-1 TaxID=2692212 RepID=UPI00136AE582|nr:sugar transporter [Flavobacterium sp. HBTb2-11-1]MXO05997.1 sugar transporter [Flavobacterium sp. HBTb2-11-1]
MKNYSRIKKSVVNVKFALTFFVINIVLQFFYRKVFLDVLGSDILGLNTTAMNLLQFLNLAELGVGAAVSYSLYKPLNNNNQKQVNEIVSIQGYLYSRIGMVVLIAAIILMLFFPFFFSDIKISLWYAYTTFGVLLVSALIGYFLNYQQIVLVSDQKEYKLNYAIQGTKIIKVVLQILTIYFLDNGYIWWLFWELMAIFVTVFGIKYILDIEYPWLDTNIHLGKKLMIKYPDITHKTKQLITHKIAGFALNESSPLIIFAFTSLSFVASYGNYLLIILGITALLGAVFNSTNAGVGNLVSEGNLDKIISVFKELFALRFFLSCIACYGVYKLTPVFVVHWVGKQYLLEKSNLILLVLIMFINVTRLTVDSFINAYGLFNDIAAPIIETFLNIGLSILLGYFFGINGILVGVLCSLCLIVLFWKPFFLFKSGFKFDFIQYFIMYSKLLTTTAFTFCLTEYLISKIKIDPYLSLYNFIIYSFIIIFIFFILLLIGFLSIDNGMRQLYLRCKLYLTK